MQLKLFHDIFDQSLQPLEELEYEAEEAGSADAWHKVGMGLFQKFQFHLAVDAFGKALQHDPDHVRARFHRGVSQVIMGKFEPAIDDFTRVLQVEPDHFGALYNRGRLLARLRRHQEALTDFERATAIDGQQAAKLNVPRVIRTVQRRLEGRRPSLSERFRDWLDDYL